jgi:peptidoglycan hydrolase-like protein with peptidoglycan-binding domain
MRLEYVRVSDGTVLDRLTVDDGSVDYETGAARSLVSGLARIAGSESKAVGLLADGWSNGYSTLRPAETVDLGRAYSQEQGAAQPSSAPQGGQFALGGGRVGAKGKKSTPRRPASGGPAKPKAPAGPLSFDGKTGTGYGVKGGDPRVRQLQAALNRLGLSDSSGTALAVDGRYGPRTTSSVKKLQKALGLPADGKVTPELLKQAGELKQLPERPSRRRRKPAGPTARREQPARRSRILAQVSRALGEHRIVDGVCVSCDPGGEGDDQAVRALVAALDEIERFRRVRTEAGARKYGLPIGSIIGGGGDAPTAPRTPAAQATERPRPPAPLAAPKVPVKASSAGSPKRATHRERLVSAINDHLDGKGDGQPLKEFTREQLRQAAKARGIRLDRGESEESIGKKILDHARGGEKATPAKVAEPEAPNATPKASGAYTGPSFSYSSERKQRIADELIPLMAEYNANRGLTTEDRSRARELATKIDGLTESARFNQAESGRTAQLARIHASTDEWRRNEDPGMSDADLKADAERRSREAWAGKPVAVRVTSGTLGKILDSGRIKSQFETKSSSALYDPKERAIAEERWFGIAKGSDPTKRPIYGYLAVDGTGPVTGDSYLSQYGDVQVVLKDSVKDRTTAMWGDSLNQSHQGIPEPLHNPTWRSYTLAPVGLAAGETMKLDRDVHSDTWKQWNFVETQIHGGVGTDDIAEIVLPKDPTPALRASLEQAGIPWRVT